MFALNLNIFEISLHACADILWRLFDSFKEKIAIFESQCLILHTVESSLWAGFNVCWFRGIPFPTNLCPHNKVMNCVSLILQQTSYPRNYVSTNQQNFDNPWTLDPTNMNDSTVFVINNDLGALKFTFFALCIFIYIF